MKHTYLTLATLLCNFSLLYSAQHIERFVTNRANIPLSSMYIKTENPLPGNPVVMWVHGMGSHSRRSKYIMNFLVERGISIVAFDFRGHGFSGGKRGHVNAYQDLLDDIEDVYCYYKSALNNNFFIVGCSMGGLMSTLFIEQRTTTPPIKKAILLIPAFGANRPTYQQWAAIAVGYSFPDYKLPDTQHSAYKDDPYVLPAVTGSIARELYLGVQAVFAGQQNIRIPIHIIVGAHDEVVDNKATTNFYDQLPYKLEKSYTIIEDMGHGISTEENKREVAQDIYDIIVGSVS